MGYSRIPAATYRLQFNRHFRFEEARALVAYFHRLGVTDLYASPIFKARRGSKHGYDVTDSSRLNPELGTGADFDRLVQQLQSNNMGFILDIVPNHMAASKENPWWQDVLDKGQDSPFAAYFDTDWLSFKHNRRKSTGHRRFFDIGDLIGVRVEDPRVFEAAHSLVLRLINSRKVTGLRIDHIDGLYDPQGYLLRLHKHLQPEIKGGAPGFYIVVEKILTGNEALPERWPVSGTTGYDFAGVAGTLLVDGRGTRALDEIYSRFTGSHTSFEDIVYVKKKQVMAELFPSEIKALGRYLAYLAHQDKKTAGIRARALTQSLIEFIACLPVYRTYIRVFRVSSRDRLYLEHALNEARRHNPGMDNTALDFLMRVLTLDIPDYFNHEQRDEWLRFVLRWQQMTGAVMAKGFEDTALYNYHRLVSLNDVGCSPGSAGLSVPGFHRFNRSRLKHWPHTMNATSTHDTKRSEDVRARISVLSEIPGEWEEHLARWHQWNRTKKPEVKGLPVPEPNTEMLLYQTMIGAWPIDDGELPGFKNRLKDYMIKSVREAKTHTSWLSPGLDYETALTKFVDSMLEDSKDNDFIEDFKHFEKKIAFYGALNSLAQVLLKINSPGVPDFYQGTELWDFSLVDPDNRRPVDFKRRREYLDEIVRREAQGRLSLVRELLDSWQDGRVKLYVIYKALNNRKANRDIYQSGNYQPVRVAGNRQEHIIAFGRTGGGRWSLTVAPRLFAGLADPGILPLGMWVWGDSMLRLPDKAPEQWINIFTGEDLAVSGKRKGLFLKDVLSAFPFAVLMGI